jgi:hypothetical protein
MKKSTWKTKYNFSKLREVRLKKKLRNIGE